MDLFHLCPPIFLGRTTPLSNFLGRTTPLSNFLGRKPPLSNFPGRTTPLSNFLGRTTPLFNFPGRTTPLSNFLGRTTALPNFPKRTTPLSLIVFITSVYCQDYHWFGLVWPILFLTVFTINFVLWLIALLTKNFTGKIMKWNLCKINYTTSIYFKI